MKTLYYRLYNRKRILLRRIEPKQVKLNIHRGFKVLAIFQQFFDNNIRAY